MAAAPQIFEWQSPGKVASAFFLDRQHPVCGIMGPVGSGKTGTVIARLLAMASEQAVSPRTGRRMSKWVIMRGTYTDLERTTIPSWHKRVPADFGRFTGGKGRPGEHALLYRLPDGSVVDAKFLFAASEGNEQEIASFTKGFEPTGAWLNEADQFPPAMLSSIFERVGRYPELPDGGPTWSGVLLDFNAPDIDHYLTRDLYDDPLPGHKLYIQPSALSPEAENLHNLPAGYYERQIEILKRKAQKSGRAKNQLRRQILNEFGASGDGEPVFEEYSDQTHLAPDDIEPVKRLPLILGADAGLTPAVVILQRLPDGRWLVLDELVAEETGVGAVRFGERLGVLLGTPRYVDLRVGEAWADPAGNARASTDEESWMDAISAASGVRFRGVSTNNVLPRLEAVRAPLGRVIDHRPGLLLSRRCRVLRRALVSGYHYRRVSVPGGGERYADVPAKNEYSHVADALQYALLGGGEWTKATRRRQDQRDQLRGHAGGRPVVAPHDFSVW